MASNPVCWFEIYAQDIALAFDTEGNLFGLHATP